MISCLPAVCRRSEETNTQRVRLNNNPSRQVVSTSPVCVVSQPQVLSKKVLVPEEDPGRVQALNCVQWKRGEGGGDACWVTSPPSCRARRLHYLPWAGQRQGGKLGVGRAGGVSAHARRTPSQPEHRGSLRSGLPTLGPEHCLFPGLPLLPATPHGAAQHCLGLDALRSQLWLTTGRVSLGRRSLPPSVGSWEPSQAGTL